MDPKGDFLSGTSGEVWGKRATSQALVADAYADARALLSRVPSRLRQAARTTPRRRVLVLGVEREDEPNLLASVRQELLGSRHDVQFESTPAGQRGKFENLNALLAAHPPQDHDWLLVIDDDVQLPGGFLDAFVFLIERFDLRLAQPAHRARSHAAWQVTRRRPGSVLRQTVYVEIGPVIAFHPDTYDVLLPFPELRAGWGLDAHWAALAAQHGWRLGIVDATPVRHGLRRIAARYDRAEAIQEGHRFLSGKPYLRAAEAQRTLVVHRTW
jgi:hypothetical protein